jgi:hypothetical protein
MPSSDVQFLTAEQARFLVEVAEQARARLSRFAGYDVTYDATALQLLDEWIERTLKQSPHPSQEMQTLWLAFLGEAFRRRFEGEWVVHQDGGRTLAILCPAADGGLRMVEVAQRVRQRIREGFSASLALFYLSESILLKQRRDFL